MRYWDSSALAALCVEERTTSTLRPLMASAPVVTWALSRVEISSAIERRSRERTSSPAQRLECIRALDQLATAWTEIGSMAAVCEYAVRLLAVHDLRAGDAMQLGAALVAFSGRPRGHEFVCNDRRLREAAGREGFRVLPE